MVFHDSLFTVLLFIKEDYKQLYYQAMPYCAPQYCLQALLCLYWLE